MLQYKLGHLGKWVFVALLFLVVSACGSSEPSIVGKWEIVSGRSSSIGTLYEFFEDGTVSQDGLAGRYSWPDKAHLKLEIMMPTVYTVNLAGDELTLTDSISDPIVMKRYQEFDLSLDSVAGTWVRNYPDDSDCFNGLGIESTPWKIILGADGTVIINNEGEILEDDDLALNGQYSINGNELHVVASGIVVNSGFFSSSQTEVQGEFGCTAIVSHSRLTVSDALGQTLFVKASQ